MQSAPASGPEAPFISILIPTYRRPDLVRQAVERCLEQMASLPESIEIVVTDNCPDRSAEEILRQDFGSHYANVRYVHEPRKGIAFARNRAIEAARGRYVIFLDDDQSPQEGWLAAFVEVASSGAKAAFGPLTPSYDVSPERHCAILDRVFSRLIPAGDGDDISAFYPYLGTGNSLFDKVACFSGRSAFDARFNKIGGEDIWMLKGLLARNIRFIWVPKAYVLERVPPERMTAHYLAARRYRSGQVRSLLTFHPARRRPLAVLFWMGAGAIQAGFYGARFLVAYLFQRHLAEDFFIRSAGGVGKIFWFRALSPRSLLLEDLPR